MKTQDIKNNPEEKIITLHENPISDLNNATQEDTQIEKQDKLNQITSTKEQLAKIKIELDKMIDAFAQNRSLLSRAAKFWGELPWWQKVIAGSIIFVPLLAISFITHILVLIVISLFSLLAFVGGSFLLDNHHQQSQNDKSDLKTGILSLADTLGTVIESLEQLRQDLANEITKFQTENEHLKLLVEELSKQVDQLKVQVSHLVDVEQQLDVTKEKLQKTSAKFSTAVEEHKKLLEQNKLQLEKTIQDYEESQAQLSAKILELDEVKTKMGIDLEQANLVAQTLRETTEEFYKTLNSDESQQASFKERINEFLMDRSKGLDQLVDSNKEIRNKLHAVQEELKLSNERYNELLKRQEEHLDRLDKVCNPSSTSLSPTANLKKIGFYAIDDTKNRSTLPDAAISTSPTYSN
ncbi:inclusion membrane protein A [Legionella busanensis]|uniref:Inclusion membrane protein A n=1 Tax=Legionella busanensis TaxID=190655 RepID=A0A378JIQ8_9GAMM|nr:LegC2/C7 family Dot/Icm T4SS effector [Legionella busanensis]STX51085.1 inclusion membrane protein A [Legionella busanensis]